MLTTLVKEVRQGVFRPLFQVSLGPKYQGQVSPLPEEAYGYLWVMTVDPSTNAFLFFQIRHMGLPYNYVVRRDIPSSISFSNMITLHLPEPQNIVWASFGFDKGGRIYLAAHYKTPSGDRISVFDSSGTELLEISGAKEPAIFPEYFINRSFHDSSVYLFYLPSNESEVSYVSIENPDDAGTVTTLPVSVRGGLALSDYIFRNTGIELIYSTSSNTLVFVEVEADGLAQQEVHTSTYGHLLERFRRAYRVTSRISFSPTGNVDRIAKVLFLSRDSETKIDAAHNQDLVSKSLLLHKSEDLNLSIGQEQYLQEKTLASSLDDSSLAGSFHSIDEVQHSFLAASAFSMSLNSYGHDAEIVREVLPLHDEDYSVSIPGLDSVAFYENTFPLLISSEYSGCWTGVGPVSIYESTLPMYDEDGILQSAFVSYEVYHSSFGSESNGDALSTEHLGIGILYLESSSAHQTSDSPYVSHGLDIVLRQVQ